MTRRPRSRVISIVSIAALLVVQATPSFAYLKFGYEVNGKDYTLKWTSTPVRYFVSDVSVPSVTSVQFQQAVANAFKTWEAVPTASISYQFGGFTRSLPGQDDGRSTLGFQNEPDLDRVLASTSYLVDGNTGELIESDIFFNSAFQWSTAATGERGRWDVESIALHEIGHLSGLGHSAIGETELAAGGGRRVLSTGAVMFPIALGSGDITSRRLQPDDIAGISDLYPDGGFNDVSGSVSGRITRSGRGVFGAHIVAFDPRTGEMVGNFSLSTDGQFSIAGLRPGPHVLRVEPIDDADTESFFELSEPTDLNFLARYFEHLVIVPRGGDSGAVVIKVEAK
ncbi:MAG TPA: matrixin family metalloprotease [Vicinamibacterales bacterium]|nr:matrixin family metalloprotease [Vicinamibacterales bacterium]